MTDKTLTEVIAEMKQELKSAKKQENYSTKATIEYGLNQYKLIANKYEQIIRTLVKREELLREALGVCYCLMKKDGFLAVAIIEEALSLTDPIQPWKG